jgi:hypothetical protein
MLSFNLRIRFCRGPGTGTDQRGAARSGALRCDIGAFEADRLFPDGFD